MSTGSVRARLTAATPGPWWVQGTDVMSHVEGAPGLVAHLFASDEAMESDADLAAHARTDLELALAVIEAAKRLSESKVITQDGGLLALLDLDTALEAWEAAP